MPKRIVIDGTRFSGTPTNRYERADVEYAFRKANPYHSTEYDMDYDKAKEFLDRNGHNPTNLAIVASRDFYKPDYVVEGPSFWDNVKKGAETLGNIAYGFLGPMDATRRALASAIYSVGEKPSDNVQREIQDRAYAPGAILDYRSTYPTPTYGYEFARAHPFTSAVADVGTAAVLNAGLGTLPTAFDNVASYAAREAVEGPVKTAFVNQIRTGALPEGVQGAIERTVVPVTKRIVTSGASDGVKRAVVTKTVGNPNVSTGAPNYLYRPTNTFSTGYQAIPQFGYKAVDKAVKWYEAPLSTSGGLLPGTPQFVPPLVVEPEENSSTIYETEYYPSTLNDVYKYAIDNYGLEQKDTLDVVNGPWEGSYIYRVDKNAKPGKIKYTQVNRKYNGSDYDITEQNVIPGETDVIYDVQPNGYSVKRERGYTPGTRGEYYYPAFVPLSGY